MSAIKIIGDNEGRRDPVSSDRTTVYTDGYKNLITASTTYSIANVLAAAGVITLTNAYVPGTHNLTVKVNGQDLVQPGVDYTELSNTTIQLSAGWVSLINSDPTNSTIYIEWNRPLPGARDQELNNLRDVSPDLSDAIKDVGALRSTANAGNPLATIADIGGGVSPLEGKTVVPVDGSGKYVNFFEYDLDLSDGYSPIAITPTPILSGRGTGAPIFVLGGVSAAVGLRFLVSPPTGATHAVLSIQYDADAHASATCTGNIVTRVGPYTSTPISLAGVDHAKATEISLTSVATGGTDNQATSEGTQVVPLNTPANPTGDLTLLLENVSVTQVSLATETVRVVLLGFLVDEIGRSADPVSFSAVVGPGQSIPTPGGAANAVKVNFSTIRFNTGSGFNLSTDVFTAPVGGKYFFSGDFAGDPTPTAIALQATICKNGTPTTAVEVILGSGVANASSGANVSAVSGLLELAVGDTVALYAAASTGLGSSIPISTAQFQGHLVTADNTGLVFNGMLAEKTTSQSTSGGSAYVSSYTTTEIDTYGAFSAASGIYTVPLDGIYAITGTVYWNAATSGSAQQRHLVVSTSAGSITHSMVPSTSETDPTQQISYKKQLTAGQTVRLQILSPGTDEPISYARLEIQKIG